jgi:acetylornithine deacetylase
VPFTTVHVGTIKGGTALNIVPRDCQFDFEIRHLPFDDPGAFFRDVQQFAQKFVAEMQSVARETYIEFDHMSTLPFLDTDDHSEIAKIGRGCNHGTSTGRVSYGTEAALFFNASIPTVICGPGHIDQAHQPNEWCEVSQLAQCETFMRRLADHMCADA